MSRAAAPGALPKVDAPPIQNESNTLSPKILYGAAIVVGVVALFFGACGTTGLLQAYGKIHLAASWFTEAATQMGHAGLWALAVTGTTAGAILIPLGIYKLVKGKPESEETPFAPTTLLTPQAVIPQGFSTQQWDQNLIRQQSAISNFDTFSLKPGHYAMIPVGDRHAIGLIRSTNGELNSTNVLVISEIEAQCLGLLTHGYNQGHLMTAENSMIFQELTADKFTALNPNLQTKINREMQANGSFTYVKGGGRAAHVVRDLDGNLRAETPGHITPDGRIGKMLEESGFKNVTLTTATGASQTGGDRGRRGGRGRGRGRGRGA